MTGTGPAPPASPAAPAAAAAAGAPAVFADLVDQDRAVATLAAAAAAAAAGLAPAAEPAGAPTAASARAAGMTHAWLFAGPPGSGRSLAARALAAALECPRGGCGDCHDCRTVAAGTHADVEALAPEGLSIGVREARELVRRSALAAVGGRWRVMLVEDADRLTEGAADVLLKAVEEPAERTVWLLCAPSAEDLPPTLRSRCRLVRLALPRPEAVAAVLERRDGVSPELAGFAARAAAGHIGRARWLATDERARRRRRDVLAVPTAATTVPVCLAAAAELEAATKEESAAVTEVRDAAETAELREALGEGATGRPPRGAAGALRDLAARQRSRGTRTQRDALDRALGDLAAFYRDVLVHQLAADVPLVCADVADAVARLARASTPASTVRRLSAVLDCASAVAENVNPLLALEAMVLELRCDRL